MPFDGGHEVISMEQSTLQVDGVAHGLEGDSFFIASKAANFDTLVLNLIAPRLL